MSKVVCVNAISMNTKMDLDLSGLNASQRDAVLTTEGKLLILAGAGSGKTRVLTLRIAHLIQSGSARPDQILGLTFTNKAAWEMRHRLNVLIGRKKAQEVILATFHSFCMQVLRKEASHLGYTQLFTLYDEHDLKRLVNAIARDILDHESEMPSLSSTLTAISWAKNKGLMPDELSGSGSQWNDAFNQQVYRRLSDSLRAHNAVDFDHLLWLVVQLFENYPQVLSLYQKQFQYVLIDEYQDTNPVQSRLAELLISQSRNLCVVGDDDQSIYAFRGADVHHILHFESDKTIKLEQNYRSTNSILKAANAVISKNTKRHKKHLWSEKGDGALIEVFSAPTEKDEAEAIVLRALYLREKQSLKWSDMAILYRSNSLSRPLELALIKSVWIDNGVYKQGIPYRVFGGTEFYERKEVKDLLAYLRVIVNPLDHEALLRVINHPRRGIGESSLDTLTALHRKNGCSLMHVLRSVLKQTCETVSDGAIQGIKSFLSVIDEAKERFVSESMEGSMRWLVEKLQYKKAIEEEVKSDTMREFKWGNVEDLLMTMQDYEAELQKKGSDGTCRLKGIVDFVSTMLLDKENHQKGSGSGADLDCVTLMTFHSAKGLEFPACFLIGMEDHIIPHERSVKEGNEEEERRLMYVAITRAMRFLTLSMAMRRKKLGQEVVSKPSRFMFDIPQELLRITKWDRPDKERIH